jgi:hypothetical protein
MDMKRLSREDMEKLAYKIAKEEHQFYLERKLRQQRKIKLLFEAERQLFLYGA